MEYFPSFSRILNDFAFNLKGNHIKNKNKVQYNGINVFYSNNNPGSSAKCEKIYIFFLYSIVVSHRAEDVLNETRIFGSMYHILCQMQIRLPEELMGNRIVFTHKSTVIHEECSLNLHFLCIMLLIFRTFESRKQPTENVEMKWNPF